MSNIIKQIKQFLPEFQADDLPVHRHIRALLHAHEALAAEHHHLNLEFDDMYYRARRYRKVLEKLQPWLNDEPTLGSVVCERTARDFQGYSAMVKEALEEDEP